MTTDARRLGRPAACVASDASPPSPNATRLRSARATEPSSSTKYNVMGRSPAQKTSTNGAQGQAAASATSNESGDLRSDVASKSATLNGSLAASAATTAWWGDVANTTASSEHAPRTCGGSAASTWTTATGSKFCVASYNATWPSLAAE